MFLPSPTLHNVIMPIAVLLNVTSYDCHSAECQSAKHLFVECHSAEYLIHRLMNVILLNVVVNIVT